MLGDKGRWLTTGDVAKQLTPVLPLLAQMILLCFAKIPGDETTLGGKKHKRAHAVFVILNTRKVVYRMQVVTILMDAIFIPLYEAFGRQEHTQFGGEDGIISAYKLSLSTLDRMVIKKELVKNKKTETLPAPEFFDAILPKADDAEGAILRKQVCQEVVSHVATVRDQIVRRFQKVTRIQFRAADITEEKFVAFEDLNCYIKVPTEAAVAAVKDILSEYDCSPAPKRQEFPKEVRLLCEPDSQIRQQLEEFGEGRYNEVTGKLMPLRHWPELEAHLGHFIRFRLASSAYCEGRFSIASNASRTRPNSTTKTLSGFIRRRSNFNVTEYPSVIFFTDIDPAWNERQPIPELPKRLTHRIVSRARTFDADFERLSPEARKLVQTMKPVYQADFVAKFAKQHASSSLQAAEGAEEGSDGDVVAGGVESESEEDSDQDIPLSNLAAAPLRLAGSTQDRNAAINLGKGRTWKRNGRAVDSVYDEDGNEIGNDDPLAARKSNFVWEDQENGIVVMLSKPKRKPPENATADKAHGQPLRKFKYFTHMKVQDEFGEIYSFDLSEDDNSEMAVIYYDDAPCGDKILWIADILGIYTTPEGIPYIEHGYLFDSDEIETDATCRKFLAATEIGSMGRILEDELVNCTSIYHTHAACVEGKVKVVQIAGDQDLPEQGKLFWRRVVDLTTGKELPATKLRKPRCL